MSVRVKIATEPVEIRSLLAVRHRVFVDEDHYLAPQGGFVVDVYDALPTTVNFVAVEGAEVHGGVRLTADSEAGMPADQAFDFRAAAPEGARLTACSMLCMSRSRRGVARLLGGMLKMGAYWAYAHRMTHLCAPVNPKVAPILRRIGFQVVGDQYVDPKGLPTLPMLLDLAAMSDAFVDFIERQEIGLWIENFEREFFDEGEVVIAEGTPGDRAFVLVDGEVAVLAHGSAPGGPVVAHFAPGELFGEVSLLTDLPRAATVVASTLVEVMTLDRAAFDRQILTKPELALALLRSLGRQFHEAILARGEARR